MNTPVHSVRDAAAELKRITTSARLLLVDRPTPTEVVQLRELRIQPVAGLARFQLLVHHMLDEASGGDAANEEMAVNLKIGAIALGQAYDEFRGRWQERSFLSNWPEYRLSANRMIHTILLAVEPVERLQIPENDMAGQGAGS